MAKFDVLDMNGKKVSTIELSDAVFGMTPNEKVMHAAVAASSRGARRAPAARVRARSALRSGRTAALPWAPSPAITATA